MRPYEGVAIETDIDKTVKDADAIVIFAGHKQYYALDPAKAKKLMKQKPAIIDGRNVIEPDKWINAGYSYKGIGRGDKNAHKLS